MKTLGTGSATVVEDACVRFCNASEENKELIKKQAPVEKDKSLKDKSLASMKSFAKMSSKALSPRRKSAAAADLEIAVASASAVEASQPTVIIPAAKPNVFDIAFDTAQPLGLGFKASASGAALISSSEKSEVPVGSLVVAIDGMSCAGDSKDVVMKALKEAKARSGTMKITFGSDPGATIITKRVTFDSSAPLGITLREHKATGTSYVSEVDSTSSAAAGGVQVGATVVSINGVNFKGQTKVKEGLKAAKEAGATLTVVFEMERGESSI